MSVNGNYISQPVSAMIIKNGSFLNFKEPLTAKIPDSRLRVNKYLKSKETKELTPLENLNFKQKLA